MRLLKYDIVKDGNFTFGFTFSLVEFDRNHVPDYAILSHRWGAKDEEVSFKDMENNTASSKVGYQKLQFCAEQAAKDGISYFWIDTCCIDKSSSTELSEAINSMFAWYRDASRCYVYLLDVSVSDWKSSLQHSQWFKRGWTLQELIASKLCFFFSKENKLIGDKTELETRLHEITQINRKALQGTPLSEFSFVERMSWAARRQTTVEEDSAYCLFGILDVNMPLLYGEGKTKALRRLQREFEVSFNTPTGPIALPTENIWVVPFGRNSRFSGREIELGWLEEKMFRKGHTEKIAVAGLGGIGKTQLVLELACRFKEKYQNCPILWVPAMDIKSLEEAYLNIAQQLNISGWANNEINAKRLVQHYLNGINAGQWLLIMDNADDINMWTSRSESGSVRDGLMEFLPKSNRGCVVFTTRDEKVAVKLAHEHIKLTQMTKSEGIKLLRRHLVKQNEEIFDHDIAHALLEHLTYLPLAIVQAASYIRNNGITIADYLSLLKEQEEEELIELLSEDFEDEGRYRAAPNPTAVTWLASFERIKSFDMLAVKYLSFMSCVNSENIPKSLLPKGASRKAEMDAIGTLVAYSFISKRHDEQSVDVHRLVHLAVRYWLKKEGCIDQWTEEAISRLVEVFPTINDTTRPIWRSYLAHAQHVLKYESAHRNRPLSPELKIIVQRCLYDDGRLHEAEILLLQIIRWQRNMLGNAHVDTLTSRYNLAMVYASQGHIKKSFDMQSLVVKDAAVSLSLDHELTLKSKSSFAATLTERGSYSDAEDLLNQVIDRQRNTLGKDHMDTLRSTISLGRNMLLQGRSKEAEKALLCILNAEDSASRGSQPLVLDTMLRLADVYIQQRRLELAETITLWVLEHYKKGLGQEHPITILTMLTLGRIYRDLRKDDSAQSLASQALQLGKGVLPAQHQLTYQAQYELSVIHASFGRFEVAEQLAVDSLQGLKANFGEAYYLTLDNLAGLRDIYLAQERWNDARPLAVQLVEGNKMLYGDSHTFTTAAMEMVKTIDRKLVHTNSVAVSRY
jgi:tetratricopeptide (TPR) repeat protein